jgi:hypothetical protein
VRLKAAVEAFLCSCGQLGTVLVGQASDLVSLNVYLSVVGARRSAAVAVQAWL